MAPLATKPSNQYDTRTRILDAAEAVFVERGWHAANMRDVADRAGLAVSSLYNHFPSKEALFEAALDRRALEMEVDGIRGYVELLEVLPEDLTGLVRLVRDLVGSHETFVRLAIIDSLEFGSKHISGMAFDFGPVVEAVIRPSYECDVAAGKLREFDLITVTRFMHLALFGYFAIARLRPGRPAAFQDEETETQEIARVLESGILAQRKDA